MFDNKFLITLIGLVVAIVAINNINSKEDETKEGFLGNLPSMTWKIDQIAAPSQAAAKRGEFTSLPQNSNLSTGFTSQMVKNTALGEFYTPKTTGIGSAQKGDFFTVPGNYQSSLTPRFSNTNYGSNIKYNMPSTRNQAVPCNPLTFNTMSKESYAPRNTRENYCGSCGEGTGVPSCGKGGAPSSYKGGAPVMDAGYASGNYNGVLNDVYSATGVQQLTSTLPVDTMTSASANGEPAPVVYDRFIFSNRNSRIRSQGDPIRGDLPIVPCNADWFRPSVQPNVDLQQGAMNVMGGIGNETGQKLDALIYANSGFSDTALSGINEPHNALRGIAQRNNMVSQSNQMGGGLSAGMYDITVNAFP